MRLAVTAILASLAVSVSAQAQSKPKLAMMPLKQLRGVEADVATMLTDMMTTEAGKLNRYDVMSLAEVEALLGLEKMKEAAGCDGYVAKPIHYQDKIYGMIYLKISPEIKKEIYSRIIVVTILAFGLIFMAYLLARYSQRIISDPILMLSDAAKKISDAHNYSIRLENTHEGEVAILYDSFNSMLETIQTRQNERDAAERKYKGIFKNAVEGIFRISADGRILTANPSFAAILGYHCPDEIVSSEKQSWFPAAKKDKNRFMQLLDKEGKIVDHRIQLFKKSRDKLWCSISASKIHNEEGNYIRES